MAKSTEGKFLETSKNYIKVISTGAGLVGTVSIDNFTEISVNVQYVDDVPVGIKCKFGNIEYNVNLIRSITKLMNKDKIKFSYYNLRLIVMDRLHIILNEKFWAMDYVEKGILFIDSNYFGETIVLDLDSFMVDALKYVVEKEKEKEKRGITLNVKVREKEDKKEKSKDKDKNKKENKKESKKENKNKKDKKDAKVK